MSYSTASYLMPASRVRCPHPMKDLPLWVFLYCAGPEAAKQIRAVQKPARAQHRLEQAAEVPQEQSQEEVQEELQKFFADPEAQAAMTLNSLRWCEPFVVQTQRWGEFVRPSPAGRSIAMQHVTSQVEAAGRCFADAMNRHARSRSLPANLNVLAVWSGLVQGRSFFNDSEFQRQVYLGQVEILSRICEDFSAVEEICKAICDAYEQTLKPLGAEETPQNAVN